MDFDENDQNDGGGDELRNRKDCGVDYTFTVGEARFYTERGFDAPKRCADCRVKARERHQRSGPHGW